MNSLSRLLTLVVLVVIIPLFAKAQSSQRNTLSVPKFNEISAKELINSLSSKESDTGKVWLLNKIAAVYWWRRSSHFDDLDSCIIYARQAKDLSFRLKFQSGISEFTF
jgi:hypothetical protein